MEQDIAVTESPALAPKTIRRGKTPLPPGQRRVFLSVRIRPSTRKALDLLAKQNRTNLGRTIDDIVSLLIVNRLIRQQPEDDDITPTELL